MTGAESSLYTESSNESKARNYRENIELYDKQQESSQM